jgi:hypothetical protein
MTDRSRHPRRLAGLRAAALAAVAIVAIGCLPAGAGGGLPTAVPAASGPTPRPSFRAPTPTPAPTFAIYTVARGDTLSRIADRFGTTARSIAYWNRATYPSLDPEGSGYRPNLLQVGWTLRIIPNAQFDEQTLPEPSELQGTPPTPKPTDDQIQYEDTPSPAPS